MSVHHRFGARSRRYLFVATVVATLSTHAAWALPPQQTGSGGGGRVVVRSRSCTDCDGERDSLYRARALLLSRLDSMRWEFENRRLSESERANAAREMTRMIIELEGAMGEVLRETRAAAAAGSRAAAEARRAGQAFSVRVEPAFRERGYLGVTFDGVMAEFTRPNSERVVRFYQYPRILLVEPSSPAERAGIAVGDTLLALNGDDVREHEFAFGKLLVPDARITMRVQREGGARDVSVTVGKTPDYIARRVTPLPTRIAEAPPPMPGRRVGTYQDAPAASAAQAPPGFMYWYGNDGLAGARVETITPGLAKALSVQRGVLVISAAPGSPAYQSGLRDGDVVIRAGDTDISGLRDLRRVLERRHDEGHVKLVIVREGKRRDLPLRWE